MFTKVHLENYRSLVDFDINFEKTKTQTIHLMYIYGENGSGKTNFIDSFFTLNDFFITKSYRELFEKILENKSESEKADFQLAKLKFLITTVEDIIKENKTISSTGNMVLEYHFKIKGKKGKYRIETDNQNIIFESLDYALDKKIVNLFEVSKVNKKINDKIFKIPHYKSEINTLIEKFFGKHSVMAILVSEIDKNSENYINNSFSKELKSIIDFFTSLSIKSKKSRMEKGKINIANKNFKEIANLATGVIKVNDKEKLNKLEKMLNIFYTSLYSDIKEVFYKINIEKDVIKYKLYLKKLIYGKIIEISFLEESSGTQALLDLLPFIISALEGKIVLIDEIDTGIHDLLITNLLLSIKKIKGQLIVTTHNTMLLETELNKDAFVIKIDNEGKKELVAISDFEGRIHPNINVRKRYLRGDYYGIPQSMELDYDNFLELLKE